MAFGLDPQSIADRVNASGTPVSIPTLGQSMARGMIGFMLVSVAGFLPWVLAGKWFYSNPGEIVMYSSCAIIFIVLSGVFLHQLIIGPGSFLRFYAFFGVAFLAYSVGWIAGWMGLHGQPMHLRSAVGLLIGTTAMGVIFGLIFDARSQIVKVIVALFVLNSLGYFIGGEIEGYLAHVKVVEFAGHTLSGSGLDIFMKIVWGVWYGIGLGAGLGYSFYIVQHDARSMISHR